MTVHIVVTQELPAGCATVFDRPRVAAIKLESCPPFFASWAASIRHTPLAADRSTATYTMTFTVKPRWLAPVLEPVARAMFRRETHRRLRALAAHLGAPAQS